MSHKLELDTGSAEQSLCKPRGRVQAEPLHLVDALAQSGLPEETTLGERVTLIYQPPFRNSEGKQVFPPVPPYSAAWDWRSPWFYEWRRFGPVFTVLCGYVHAFTPSLFPGVTNVLKPQLFTMTLPAFTSSVRLTDLAKFTPGWGWAFGHRVYLSEVGGPPHKAK